MGETNSGQDIIHVAAEISPLFSLDNEADFSHDRFHAYNVYRSRLWTPFAICYW
jgi:hypothetical protein